MELIISKIVTAIVNLIVFSLIPFIWWLCRHRKKEKNFFKWLGFYTPKLNCKWWPLLIFAGIYYFFYKFDFTMLLSAEDLNQMENSSAVATNIYAGLGVIAIIPAFIENFIANGVAEEILYRGFLCKRFCSKAGTVWGIVIQAVLFGLMHNVLFLLGGLEVSLWYHILAFTFTGTGALLLGWLNEKMFNGSIIPSIILHGAGNFLVSMSLAFA